MPPEVANGNHNSQDKAFFTMGMSVRYSCNPGYYLVGNAAVFCRASGNWSQPRPRCEGESGLCPLRGQTLRVALSTGDILTTANRSSRSVNSMYNASWNQLMSSLPRAGEVCVDITPILSLHH